MTTGEYGPTSFNAPEIVADQAINAVEPIVQESHVETTELSEVHREELERLRALPIELDMSFTEEGTALLAQLDEGIYHVSDVASQFLLSDPSDRKRFCNVITTDDRIIPLKNGEMYVKRSTQAKHATTYEHAEAVVDRIAELTAAVSYADLDEVLDRVRGEGQLLTTANAQFVEAICRRSPRLQMERLRTDTSDRFLIKTVLDKVPTLPTTVGEAIDGLVAAASLGTSQTGNKWAKKIQGRLGFSKQTLRALYKAIDLDPRFILVRHADKPSANSYSLGLTGGQLPPLATVAEIEKTPPRELAARVLANFAIYDIRMKDDIPGLIARSKVLSDRAKRHIIAAVMQDPRVSATASPHFLKIVESPEAEQKYKELATIVVTAIDTLLGQGVTIIPHAELVEQLHNAAQAQGFELNKHVKRVLHGLVVIEPRITGSRQSDKLFLHAEPASLNTSKPPASPASTPSPGNMPPKKVAAVPARSTPSSSVKPVTPRTPAPTLSKPEATPDELTPETAQAQAAVRSLELMRLLGQERVMQIHQIVESVMRRRIDEETTTTVFLDSLLLPAERELAEQTGTALTDEEKEYLRGVVTYHERLELVEDGQPGPAVLRVVGAKGRSGIIRGVTVKDPALLNHNYGQAKHRDG